MAIEIPNGYMNMIVTIHNSNGGASANSTVSLGMSVGVMSQVVADRIANVARDQFKTIYDSGWDVGPVKFLVGPEPFLVYEATTTEGGTATAADYTSPAVAISVTKRTGVAGRAYRGRFYLPGVIESKVGEGGVIDPTYLGDVQSMLDTLKTNLEADAAVGNLYLLHSSESPVSSPTTITQLAARSPVATMRPRQRR